MRLEPLNIIGRAQSSEKLRFNNRGSVMPFMALIIVGIVAVTALLVDHSRQEIAVQQLQSVSDAAALAAIRHLDGTPEGWRNAKRAAVTVINNSNILGAEGDTESGVVLSNSTASDSFLDKRFETDGTDPDYLFRRTKGQIGNIAVTIERGVWVADDDPDTDKMIFKNDPERIASLDEGDLALGEILQAPFEAADSVRVNLELSNLPTTFARIFSIFSSSSMGRESVAIRGQEPEICVAPIAIPLCALKLNTDPNASASSLFREEFNPDQQCEREIVAAEANAEVPNRMDGIARSNSFPRLPYEPGSTVKLNQGAIPIRAVLGIPADPSEPATAATPAQVAAKLKNLLDIQRAAEPGATCKSLGLTAAKDWNFRPLDQFYDSSGQKVAGWNELWQNPSVAQSLADTINIANNEDSNPLLKDAFGDPISGTAKRNFPHLRSYRPENTANPNVELEMQWPRSSTRVGVMYMGDMGRNNWVNPLCHSDKVNGANDLATARVAKIKVMVIAPGDSSIDYCDYQDVFSGETQESKPPRSDTNPKIVGFLEANLFDFNLDDLDSYFRGNNADAGIAVTPHYENVNTDRNPMGVSKLGIYRSSYSVGSEWESYPDKVRDWIACRAPFLIQHQSECECLVNKQDRFERQAWNQTCRAKCRRRSGAGSCDSPTSAADMSCMEDAIEDLMMAEASDADGCGGRCSDLNLGDSCEVPRIPEGTRPQQDQNEEDEYALCVEQCEAENRPNCDYCDNDWGNDWEKLCFHPPFRYSGSSLLGHVGSSNPAYIHPLLGDLFISNKSFWNDPERYYSELLFIAKILSAHDDHPLDLSRVPSLDDIIAAGPTASLTPGHPLTELLVLIKDAAYTGSTYSDYYNLFQQWEDILVTTRQGRKYVTNKFGAVLNSDLLLDFANISGEWFGAYGAPDSTIQQTEAFPVIPGTPADLGDPSASERRQIEETLHQLSKVIRTPVEYNWDKTIGDFLVDYRELAVPATHCLPLKKDNKFPIWSSTSWEQPKPRKAQWGCGGLRIRLNCDAQSLTGLSKTDYKGMKPTLVK